MAELYPLFGAGNEVPAERTDHTGEFTMYLMGIVNSTFVGRKASDHVELVDLSLEKKKAQERYNKEHKALTAGTPRSPKSSGSPQPTDPCMEPLVSLYLTSSVSLDSGDTQISDTVTTQDAPVNIVENTKKDEKIVKEELSRQLEQELPKGDKQKPMKQAGHTTKTDGKVRATPKLGRILSDGGGSRRVQRHPLEVIPEQEHSDEHIAKLDRPGRVLQHPLQRIDEDFPNERKQSTRKERKTFVAPTPQPAGRKFVREPKKMDVKQPPKRERAKPRETRAPIAKPRESRAPNAKQRNPKAAPREPKDREKPSIASPVMEKMEGLSSPEPSWTQKIQNLPKLDVSSEPLMEERELRYSSPKMTKSDVQDELSFRVWERESIPKRKSISVSSDFQDLDLEPLENPKVEFTVKQIPAQLSPLRTFPATATATATTTTKPTPLDVQHCEEENIHHEYPSPSSFTCGLSPTSLFSDDDNIFSKFQPFPDFGETTATGAKSPRSVLSDDASHFASSSTYNEESSDLESPAGGINGHSYSIFTYTNKETELTTSEDEHTTANANANVHDDLRYFREANHREPWLEKDGGVLDDTDLEFLLPPETPNEDTSEITEEKSNPSSSLQNPPKPECPINWIPCDDTTRFPPCHSRSSSNDKLLPPKRSVKFAPDLVREIQAPNPNSKKIRLPRPESLNSKDEDENIYPSVKSWEVIEDPETLASSPPKRRWRTLSHLQPSEIPKCEEDEAVASSRRRWRRCREAQGERKHVIMPCAGRLFSWPQRLVFKVSCSRHVDLSDDESVEGAESFGRSARRDAMQVRRILKGSQKRFANLTVADILKDNFQS